MTFLFDDVKDGQLGGPESQVSLTSSQKTSGRWTLGGLTLWLFLGQKSW